MLAHISKWQIANVHAMHDERSGDSKDICRVVRTEFLVLGKNSDSLPLEEMTECSLKQRRSLWRQPDDLILARLAADDLGRFRAAGLDSICMAQPIRVSSACRRTTGALPCFCRESGGGAIHRIPILEYRSSA